jgi:hypothetical protein
LVTRLFSTPGAFKASLEERLRTRARACGTDIQRLRQLVVYDRLLARLFADSPIDVVLKGGLVLELRRQGARATKDIDLRMAGDPGSMRQRLQAVGRVDLGDYLEFEVDNDPDHPTIEAPELAYEGRRYRVQAYLASKVYGRPFGLDVALAEPIVGEPEVLLGEPWLAFAGLSPARVRVYPLLSHIAEKLHAYTLPRPRPNSRIKDLPDLALLAGIRGIAADELRTAIAATFLHRGTHAVPLLLSDPPSFWQGPYRELARENRLQWPELEVLLLAVKAFLDPVLAGAAGRWDPRLWAWTEAVQVSAPYPATPNARQ